MAIPPHRHTEFKIWKDYELLLDWHSNEEFLVWVPPGVLCNLGNQPTLRIQECLPFSLSPIEKKLFGGILWEFLLCYFYLIFLFQEDEAFFWFSSVSCRNIHRRGEKNRWTSFFFPGNFEGIVRGHFTMHMPFFNQPFSKLVRKPSTGDCSWGLQCKGTSTLPGRSWGVYFSLVVLAPVS